MRLIIAEKPSVAKGIAQVVGANTRGDGFLRGSDVFVSWCFGHLAELFSPQEYGWEKWSFDTLPMIPDQWRLAVKDDCKKQFKVLKDLMNMKDILQIVCATDADREGECIFRYVYMLAGCRKPVKRLWVSSLEESEIQRGLANMRDDSDYDNLFQAGFCRAKADWLIGMNASRLFTLRCNVHPALHLGRVKTPTLALVVKRDREIRNFVKQKYYTVELDTALPAVSARLDTKEQADSLLARVNFRPAVVSELKKEEKTEKPPKLYDLTTLQRDANRIFGLTANQTLEALQKLYEAKYATYPRTDSQYLSEDSEATALDVLPLAETLLGAEHIDAPDIRHCINNAKVTGHHALLPTKNIRSLDISSLRQNEQTVLRLICARLCQACSQPHKYASVKAVVTCEGVPFNVSGKIITAHGWKKYLLEKARKDTDSADNDAKVVSEFPLTLGQKFDQVRAVERDHWTEPPKPYTEDTLLRAMEHAGQEEYDADTEKKGLGTPATRAGIIEELVHEQYIERSGKKLSATETGTNLIAVAPDKIKSPHLTVEWETQLQQIEHGAYSADSFMRDIEGYVTSLCKQYGTLDDSSPLRAAAIGNCPKCGAEIENGKYGFYCKGKCGMFFKVYGRTLTTDQLKSLLQGKSITLKTNGHDTTVLPEIVEHEYNGKTSWQWKTQKNG